MPHSLPTNSRSRQSEQKQLYNLVDELRRLDQITLRNRLITLLEKSPNSRGTWTEIMQTADPDETHYRFSTIHLQIARGNVTPNIIIGHIGYIKSEGSKSIRILAELALDLTKNRDYWTDGDMDHVHRYIEQGLMDRIQRAYGVNFGVYTRKKLDFSMEQSTKDIIGTLVTENNLYQRLYKELDSRDAWK